MSAYRYDDLYDKADVQPVEPDAVVISIGNVQQQNNYSNTNIYRRGSASRLVKDVNGSVKVERKNTDLSIAIQRKLTTGSLPSIIPVKAPPIVEPLIGTS